MRILHWIIGLACIFLLLGLCQGQGSSLGPMKHTCDPISIPMCQEMPYNGTKMPNMLQHRTQEEAAIMAHEFLPLVDIKCSAHTRFFICSVFAPMCAAEINFGVPACRSVCQAVKQSCLPVMMRLNFTWPSFLKCEIFPEDGLCMMPPELDVNSRPNQVVPPTRLTPSGSGKPNYNGIGISHNHGAQDSMIHSELCPGTKRLWISANEKEGVCAPFCGESFLFNGDDKKMAVTWAASWAVVCFASTAFSVLTFCLDTKRFKYPERPVICLALSYFFYCLPFIFRSMSSPSSLSCEVDPNSGIHHLAASGTSSTGCIITFLLQYYFGFASNLWWTILTFCWFMSTSRYWSSEGLTSFASYFHLVAWGTPAIGTVLVIIFKQVDADELLGLCFVGNLRPSSLLRFIILPQAILLTMGTVFIICGFVSLIGIRNTIKQQCRNNANGGEVYLSASDQSGNSQLTVAVTSNHLSKLERLMIRLGVFTGLSTVPAVFVLAFRLHTYFNYDEWVHDSSSAVGTSCQNGWLQNGCSSPRIFLDLFRIFMSLVVGVTSGVWVWSPKTLSIWKRTFLRFCELKSHLKKPYEAVPRADLIRAIDAKGNRTTIQPSTARITSPGEWRQVLDTSTARASITSSGQYFQRHSESSYV